jgi:hypothetical protein
MADLCPRCEDAHPLIRCPYVKSVTFADTTTLTIRSVEFLTPADYGPQPLTRAPPGAEEAPDYPRLGKS